MMPMESRLQTVHHIGIADMQFTNDPSAQLVAANLGSCLGISIFDPSRRYGGMVHCLLPLSKKDLQRAEQQPTLFVDTGVTALLDEFLKSGSRKEQLRIVVAGGAHMIDMSGTFEVGKNNFTVLRKILWKNGLLISAEDVGGHVPRTLLLDVGTGQTSLKIGTVTRVMG